MVTSAAVTVDAFASYADYNGSVVTPGRKSTAITTAATTDVVLAPAASTYRNVKGLHVNNKHVSTPVDVTVQHTDGTTVIALFKTTLQPGDVMEYDDGQGFSVVSPYGGSQVKRKTADQVHALTTLSDITDLTFAVEANARYGLSANFIWQSATATVGIGFSVNGPASPTAVALICEIIGVRTAATAGAVTSYPITAYAGGITSIAVDAVNTDYMAKIDGIFENGATAGTLALQVKAETATNVTVRAGSTAVLTRLS
ncbi:MAG: hypothetical protein H0U18_07520 [Pyrinomonadaceae bacterium]|nr:hypothetical protein [Pyrinomonadaceae bacterium]